ncbi:MAG: hypothetical protein ABJQ29_09280 [Luteolibacter sp.]
MKNPAPHSSRFIRHGTLCASAALGLFLGGIKTSSADDYHDARSSQIVGMYEVTHSNDPVFPLIPGRQWFLDFGNGTTTGNLSGKVAVSLRENPDVKVRIMVWQYFPDRKVLIIGNQSAHGSTGAVARAIWSLRSNSSEILLARQDQTVVLRPAHPRDF